MSIPNMNTMRWNFREKAYSTPESIRFSRPLRLSCEKETNIQDKKYLGNDDFEPISSSLEIILLIGSIICWNQSF